MTEDKLEPAICVDKFRYKGMEVEISSYRKGKKVKFIWEYLILREGRYGHGGFLTQSSAKRDVIQKIDERGD